MVYWSLLHIGILSRYCAHYTLAHYYTIHNYITKLWYMIVQLSLLHVRTLLQTPRYFLTIEGLGDLINN